MKYEDYFGLALEMNSLVSPSKVKAVGFDARNGVIYAAVEHKGFTTAVCAPYITTTHGNIEIDSDDLDGEIEGSFKRHCPLSVIEKLSPLSEYPYSACSKQWAQQWRRECLQRIIRSKRTSDADKAKAIAILRTI